VNLSDRFIPSVMPVSHGSGIEQHASCRLTRREELLTAQVLQTRPPNRISRRKVFGLLTSRLNTVEVWGSSKLPRPSHPLVSDPAVECQPNCCWCANPDAARWSGSS
jgi:hypothetical protein